MVTIYEPPPSLPILSIRRLNDGTEEHPLDLVIGVQGDPFRCLPSPILLHPSPLSYWASTKLVQIAAALDLPVVFVIIFVTTLFVIFSHCVCLDIPRPN